MYDFNGGKIEHVEGPLECPVWQRSRKMLLMLRMIAQGRQIVMPGLSDIKQEETKVSLKPGVN